MGCNVVGCKEDIQICIRDLHLVGYRDIYSEENHDVVEMVKPIWAPCGTWRIYCLIHRREPVYYGMGQLCPHGSTPKERGIPVPNMPLVGKTAIVLETDF